MEPDTVRTCLDTEHTGGSINVNIGLFSFREPDPSFDFSGGGRFARCADRPPRCGARADQSPAKLTFETACVSFGEEEARTRAPRSAGFPRFPQQKQKTLVYMIMITIVGVHIA